MKEKIYMLSDTKKQRAFATLLLSYACVSTKPVLSKYLLLEGWTPLSLYVLLLLTTVIILGVHEFASLQHKKSWALDRHDIKGLLLSTIAGGVIAPLLTFTALKTVTATHTVLIQSLSPIFVVLLAMIFLGERLKKNSILGILVMLLGLGILLREQIATFAVEQATVLLLAAAFIGPMSMIMHKKYIRHRHLDSIVLIRSVLSLLIVGTWMFIAEPESFRAFQEAQNIWLVLALAIIGFIVPYLLFYSSLKKIKAFEAGIISLFSPIFTILLAHSLLGESISSNQLLSLAVMMVGIILISVPLTKWRIVPSRLLLMGPLRK